MHPRLAEEGDRVRWNRFVAEWPNGDLLQSFEWGDLKSRSGWEPIRLMLEEDGAIRATVSILKRRIPIPGKSIFYAPRGPVVDFSNEDTLRLLLDEIRKLARREGAILLKVDPPEESPQVAEILLRNGFRPAGAGGFGGVQPRCVMQLDLTGSLEEILARCKEKTRYNIRLAARKGVEIKSDCTREDLPAFYRLLEETARRDRFRIRGFQYYEDMWETLVVPGYARLFLALYQGKPIAGALSFLFGDKCWYTYGASANEHRNVMPNHLLQWKMIEWAHASGCKWYDFRGVSCNRQYTPDDPLYGLNRFKEGFSPRFVQYIGEFDRPYSSLHYWLWVHGKPMAMKLLKRPQKAENVE